MSTTETNVNNNAYASNMCYKNIDPTFRTQFIHQNIYHSLDGIYKNCPISGSIKLSYKSEYNPGTINSLCKVVVMNKQPLDVADKLCDHGLANLTSHESTPCVMYPMGKDFLGTNFESREGIYDENIVLRTNYAYIIKKQQGIFPMREGEKSAVYSNPVTTIRDMNFNPINHDNLFKVAVVTVCYEKKEEMITERIMDGDKYEDVQMMASSDLLNFQIHIETVFQIAICGYHEILILTLFGKEFGIPIDDQILIFNTCIMKYGHKFKAIMMCIPPYEGQELYNYFDQTIVKPIELTKEIELKYKAKQMEKRLVSENNNSTKNQDGNKMNQMIQMFEMNDKDRLKMMLPTLKGNLRSSQSQEQQNIDNRLNDENVKRKKKKREEK